MSPLNNHTYIKIISYTTEHARNVYPVINCTMTNKRVVSTVMKTLQEHYIGHYALSVECLI